MPDARPPRGRGVSIRTRLTVWYSLSVALALAVFAGAVYFAMWRSLEAELDKKLVEGATFHSERLAHQFGEETLDHAIESVVRKNPFRSLDLEIYGPTGERLGASAELADISPVGIGPAAGDATDGRLVRGRSKAAVFNPAGAETATSRVAHPTTGGVYTIVTYARREDVAAWLSALLRLMLMLVPALLVVSTAVGHMLAARSLAPVVAMAERARSMGADRLSDRLVTPNPDDELGELARTFNALLDRIETAFTRMRQFVADASHELRTPVAVIRGEADVALSPPTSEGEALESLAVIRDEAIRMARLVDDMFLLARADAQQAGEPADELVAVRELVERAARAAGPLASARGTTIVVGTRPDATVACSGDRTRLEQLLRNLLDNATKYGGEGSTVEISARLAGDEVRISVADDGPGVPEAYREAVFDRFFCVDKARTRGAGGSGLGLPIARWIAESHGGALTLEPRQPCGCVFTVALPARVVPARDPSTAATPENARA